MVYVLRIEFFKHKLAILRAKLSEKIRVFAFFKVFHLKKNSEKKYMLYI